MIEKQEELYKVVGINVEGFNMALPILFLCYLYIASVTGRQCKVLQTEHRSMLSLDNTRVKNGGLNCPPYLIEVFYLAVFCIFHHVF